MIKFIYLIFMISLLSNNIVFGQGKTPEEGAEGRVKEIPLMGYGTWLNSLNHLESPQLLSSSIQEALKVGYRHFDCAINYGTQGVLGNAIAQSSVKREDIWITSKYPGLPLNGSQLFADVERSLCALKTDYIDLFLVHFPTDNFTEKNASIMWKNMSELVKMGKVRRIGVSNFYKQHLERLMNSIEEEGCDIKPYVNQIEINIGNSEEETVSFCRQHNILVSAYSPFGQGNLINSHPHAEFDALAAELNVTKPQLILASLMKRGISVLPKSLNVARIAENLLSQDLVKNLSEEQWIRLNRILKEFEMGFPLIICAQEAKFMTLP